LLELMVWLSWAAPVLGFVAAPALVGGGRRAGVIVQPAYTLVSALCSVAVLHHVLQRGPLHLTYPWVPQLGVSLGFYVDALAAVMMNVVSWVAFLIMVYSVKYMEREPGLARFWAMMNLFVGGMMLLVLSDNFVQMFVGWEMVGVTSYALIGHYYTDEREYWVLNYPPSHCSMKAFVMTKVGDLLMLVGFMLIYIHSGTFSFVELMEDPSWISEMSSRGLLLPALLLVMMGPLGKSAQFPLHEWLPEAMAGPTPVSALIHAATMVKAGVYLMARMLPVIHWAAWGLGCQDAVVFFQVLATVGAFTALMAASQAMVARELKRILAYSTISQIGYMMLGLGAAGLLRDYVLGLVASVLHLISHALFKATLFLASGAVIHACETKDVFQMGGVGRSMRVTFACMLISALSLAGVPPLSGFWTKEAVLSASLASGQVAPFAMAVAASALTAFYSVRMVGLVFLGPKSEHLRRLEEEGHEVREVSFCLYAPYLALTALTIAFSALAPWLEGVAHHALAPAHLSVSDGGAEGLARVLVTALSLAMVALGIATSYPIYVSRRLDAGRLIEGHRLLSALYSFLVNRWYVNPLYYKVVVGGTLRASALMSSAIEGSLEAANRLLARGACSVALGLFKFAEIFVFEGWNLLVSRLFKAAFSAARRVQTGYLNYNVLEIIIGLLLLIVVSLMIGAGVGS